MRLTDFLGGVATRQIQYYPDLVPIFGSVTATVLFGQLLYWTGKGHDPDGWIYKSQSEIEKETALTREEQESARKKLRDAGVLKEKKKGIPCRLWFLLDLDIVNDLWEKSNNIHSMRESRRQGCGKAADKDAAIPHATTSDYPVNYQKNTTTTVVDQNNLLLQAHQLLMVWPEAAGAAAAVAAAALQHGVDYAAAQISYSKNKATTNPAAYLIDALNNDFAAFYQSAKVKVLAGEQMQARAAQDAARQAAEDASLTPVTAQECFESIFCKM